ncbi:MAG: hypothetical protein K9M07_05440 [Simkaniaceae bacterium]|nr:hypothetical protein [Simkaniaceae bacterium]MCF7852663.1 hypothetical protein [Simkaniaceae bacterium]
MKDFHLVYYSFIPLAFSVLGSILSLSTRINQRFSSYLQYFVAGIIIAAISTELLPEILPTDRPVSISIGFALGVFVMIALHALVHFLSRTGKHHVLPLGLIFASALDLFIDGLLIGISFIAGLHSGVIVAISLSFCAFFLSASVASTLKRSSISWLAQLLVLTIMATALPIGCFFGLEVIRLFQTQLMVEILAFGVSALLFLSIEEFLSQAYKTRKYFLSPILFFLGFWIILILKII